MMLNFYSDGMVMFLASQDALEVMSVTYLLTYSLSGR